MCSINKIITNKCTTRKGTGKGKSTKKSEQSCNKTVLNGNRIL
jgi:hypothetical protein